MRAGSTGWWWIRNGKIDDGYTMGAYLLGQQKIPGYTINEISEDKNENDFEIYISGHNACYTDCGGMAVASAGRHQWDGKFAYCGISWSERHVPSVCLSLCAFLPDYHLLWSKSCIMGETIMVAAFHPVAVLVG